MLWTHHKIAALFTGSMMLFTPPSGKEKESPIHLNTVLTPTPRHAASSPFCIYLSFDDGPSAGSYLVNALSMQDSLEINVFLIGHNATLTSINRKIVSEYKSNPFVEIGNHSFTHADRKYDHFFRDPALVLADINRNRDSLGLSNGLVRLPGRNFFRLGSNLTRNDRNNGKEAADTLAANGYQVYGWDLEWRRKPGKGFHRHTGADLLAITTNMLETHKTFLPNQIVILVHDHDLLDANFHAELENFIHLARADGRFHFAHLSEHISP